MKYRSTFRQTNGEPFPPRYVNAKVNGGVLRCYFRGPHGKGTIKGARLVRTGFVECSARWWDTYWSLRHGKSLPVEDGAEPVVEKGGLVPGSWDALIAHYKAHNIGWKEMGEKTQNGYLIYQNHISRVIGSHGVAITDFEVGHGQPGARHQKAEVEKQGRSSHLGA
jgi:hypothetical protein